MVVNAKRQFTTANVIVNVNAQQRQTSQATLAAMDGQRGDGNMLRVKDGFATCGVQRKALRTVQANKLIINIST